MNEELTSWLNNIGAGTFVVIVLAIVAIAWAGYTKIKMVLDAHRKKVEADVQKKNEETQMKQEIEQLKQTVAELTTAVTTMQQHDADVDRIHLEVLPKIDTVTERLDMLSSIMELLIDDSKDTIKAFITEEYQKWMALSYIDRYSMSIINERFAKYEKFHGNTFVGGMVKQLRSLQLRTLIQTNDGVDPVGYFDGPDEK